MRNKDKKAIFLDLDETLLTSDKKISPATVDALHKMLDEGHIVAINTGRPTRAIKTIVGPYGLDREGVYYLGFHGSVIMDGHTGETISVNAIDSTKVIDLMKAAAEKGIYTQCFDESYLLTFNDAPELEHYNRVTHEPVVFLKSYDELLERRVTKTMVIDYENHARLEEFREFYKDREPGFLNSFFSCEPFLEYCKLGSHKGSGLVTLANMLEIDIKNTVACGDEQNDIPMIEAAGVGVAMCNAVAEAKAVANYITVNDNNHDGIKEVIEKFIL